jgi:hypothetical protein
LQVYSTRKPDDHASICFAVSDGLTRGPTKWRTAEGITIGTPLRELERFNRRPFRLAGFAVDGAGAVVSWK